MGCIAAIICWALWTNNLMPLWTPIAVTAFVVAIEALMLVIRLFGNDYKPRYW